MSLAPLRTLWEALRVSVEIVPGANNQRQKLTPARGPRRGLKRQNKREMNLCLTSPSDFDLFFSIA